MKNRKYGLSPFEQRIFNYTLTKVKPTDTAETEYTFDLDEFIIKTGAKSESYLLSALMSLRDKSVGIRMPHGDIHERLYRRVYFDWENRKVTVAFSDYIRPYIIYAVNSSKVVSVSNLSK